MKRATKKVKTPLFVIKHTNTCKGSSMFGTTFRVGYVQREDAERSSKYLTELGVEHTLIAPKVAVAA